MCVSAYICVRVRARVSNKGGMKLQQKKTEGKKKESKIAHSKFLQPGVMASSNFSSSSSACMMRMCISFWIASVVAAETSADEAGVRLDGGSAVGGVVAAISCQFVWFFPLLFWSIFLE